MEGDCKFLSEKGLCTIYPARPLICTTYPFYLHPTEKGFKLAVCKCKGLGSTMKFEKSLKLAEKLKQRLVHELTEAIQLIENSENPTG
jgi:hypothetical protein